MLIDKTGGTAGIAEYDATYSDGMQGRQGVPCTLLGNGGFAAACDGELPALAGIPRLRPDLHRDSAQDDTS